MSGYVDARLTQRHDWADGLATLRFEGEVPHFVAGQWVNVALTLGAQVVRRVYSLASAPGAPAELFLTRVTGGALSPHLFELKLGDAVGLERVAHGFFTLQYVPDAEHLWLVATGTGLAPFISMLRTDEPWHRFSRIVVVHSVREHAHLAYAAELRTLVAQHEPTLAYVPLVSREAPQAGVIAGRITAALVSGELERAAGVELAPATSHLMLCGNPDMIRDLTPLLDARGLVRHRVRKPGHVTFEKYW